MKTVGFFGGMFDPIHIGHLYLAIQLLESTPLDEVCFCPAYISPFKVQMPAKASAEHRLKMVQLALEGIERCTVSDVEIQKKGISYTIDTLQILSKEGKNTFRLLLTEDALEGFSRWKEFEGLIQLAPPLIGRRGDGFEKNIKNFSEEHKKNFRENYILTNRMEISSTEIRERLKKKQYCGHIVPKKVLDYIQQHRLYSHD